MKKKLFTKLGIAALGFAMAVVTGAAIRNSVTEAKAADTTVVMDIFANKGTVSGTSISWTKDNITFTNNKGSSSTAIRTSDSDHYRLYANSDASLTCNNGVMTNVVFTATNSGYATAFGNSYGTGATVSGSTITITPNSNTITIAKFTAQTRINKISVTYTTGSVEPEQPETPVKYTISYNANGGTGTMDETTMEAGEYTLLDCTFDAPSGKEFSGWKANNEGDLLKEGSKYPISANVTFYAQWKDKQQSGEQGGSTLSSSEMTSFTEIADVVAGTSNIIKYEAQKGSAANAPVVNSSQIRIYQNGGLLRVYSDDSTYALSSVTIGSDMNTSVVYKIGDGSFTTSNSSIAKGGKFTVSDINSNEITFKCTGTDKYSRLYLNYLFVEYSSLQTDLGELQSIDSITDTGFKTSYYEGESWDDPASKLVVNGIYTNGNDIVSSSLIEWSFNPETPRVGVTSVMITATYKTENSNSNISFSITIIDIKVNESVTYTKITSAAQIKDGGSIIIVNDKNKVALSTTQKTNNRGQTDVNFHETDENIILNPSAEVAVLTATKDSNNYYSLYCAVNEGYLTAPTGEDNHLKTASNNANNTEKWTISIDGGAASIKNVGSSKYIRYNSPSTLFSAYSSGQNEVAIYELTSDIPTETPIEEIIVTDTEIFEGGIIEYSGSYLPVNATETINATSGNEELLTLGSVVMNNGKFSIEINAGAIENETEIEVTLTTSNRTTIFVVLIRNYEASHSLVTDASTLTNGTKVVLGTVGNEVYTATNPLGANAYSAIKTPANTEEKTIGAAQETSEFTLWCVDQENQYYVFAQNGYYLCSNTSKQNYLKTSDKLNETCYFTITSDETGVVITSAYSVIDNWSNEVDGEAVATPFKLGYNKSSSWMSLYQGFNNSLEKVSLYVDTDQEVNTLDAFVDVFMHFDNVSAENGNNTGNCAGENGYFSAALSAYNSLTTEQREEFIREYDAAYARLYSWAVANNYEFANDYSLVVKQANVIELFVNNTNNLSIIIITASITVVSVFCLYTFARKTKRA